MAAGAPPTAPQMEMIRAIRARRDHAARRRRGRRGSGWRRWRSTTSAAAAAAIPDGLNEVGELRRPCCATSTSSWRRWRCGAARAAGDAGGGAPALPGERRRAGLGGHHHEFGIYPPGEFVQLKSGESRWWWCGVRPMRTPLAASVTDRHGMPSVNTVLRDTARRGVRHHRPGAGQEHGAAPAAGAAVRHPRVIWARLEPLPWLATAAGRHRGGVAQVVVADRLERGVELVDQRDAVGDVQTDDLVVGDAVQVFHQRADAVAVRRRSARAGRTRMAGAMVSFQWGTRAPPCPSGIRSAAPGRARASRSGGRRARSAGRWARVPAAACRSCGARPAPARRRTGRRVGLVQALQRAVVAFVEAPVLITGSQCRSISSSACPGGPDRALQHRGEGDVELVALGLQQAAGRLRLHHAGGREADVGPAGEAVLEVPGRFAVADQHELVYGGFGGDWPGGPGARRANSIIRALPGCRRKAP